MGGLCQSQAFWTGEEFIPCKQFVVMRNPIDRVLSTYLSCQQNKRDEKCASDWADPETVGYRRWAQHQQNYVLLRLAQARDDVLGEEHPDACTNPGGCLHRTPCWYKHNRRMELDGDVTRTFDRAVQKLSEMDGVGIFERYAETLKLFECRTGLSVFGRKEWRAQRLPELELAQSGLAKAKWHKFRELMKGDKEVQALLAHEKDLYHQAIELFERQLWDCGIRRNGSHVIMKCPKSPDGHSKANSALQRHPGLSYHQLMYQPGTGTG